MKNKKLLIIITVAVVAVAAAAVLFILIGGKGSGKTTVDIIGVDISEGAVTVTFKLDSADNALKEIAYICVADSKLSEGEDRDKSFEALVSDSVAVGQTTLDKNGRSETTLKFNLGYEKSYAVVVATPAGNVTEGFTIGGEIQ